MNSIDNKSGLIDKLQEFEILFDDPKAVYTSGDEITGKIRIVLKEPMKMHMVQLRFIGTTRVTLADPKPLTFLKRQLSKTMDKKEQKSEKQPLLQPKQNRNEKKDKKEKEKQEVQGVILGKNGLVAVSMPVNNGVVVQNGSATIRSSSPAVGRYHEMISLDKMIDLLERRPGQEVAHDFVLPTGLNMLPFSFLLPKKPMPASFESAFAMVRYICQATICKPWKHDYVTKKAFTVLPPTDKEPRAVAAAETVATTGYCCRLATATNFPHLSERLTVDEIKSSQACCATGKLSCEASISKQVYNLGEQMTIAAKLTNTSRLNVDEVKFALVQTITCKGRDVGGKIERSSVYTRPFWHEIKNTKPSLRSSTNKKAPPVASKKNPKGGSQEFEVNFRIPTMSPSMEIDSNVYNNYKSNDQTLDKRVLGGLMMLRVAYHALVQLKVGKKRDYLTVKLPFVLVGAPFVTFAQQEYDRKSLSSEPSELSECLFGAVDIREETDDQYVSGALKYAPFYPVLRIDNSKANV